MSVINTIRQVRRAAGYTQYNLAMATGLNSKHLGQIERGEAECSLEEGLVIALALGVDVKDLFSRDPADPASLDRTAGQGKGAYNLIGMQFGKLKAVARMPGTHRHRGEAFWLCECECGGLAIVRSDHLRSKHTRSCGCGVKPEFVDNNSVRI